MAQYVRNSEDFNAAKIIQIISAESLEKYTVYVIEISLGTFKWTVRHRYSEFHDLHEKLVTQHKVEKGLLPPKKLFGNQSESFVKKRQGELQHYLQLLLYQLSNVPPCLAAFLNFQTYEIHGITQTLAEELYHKGDQILHAEEWFHVTPLQLHSITSRLKLAEPTCDAGDPKKDIGHALDFVTRLKFLKIQGNKNRLGTSNICMNELTYDLGCFKSLESLELNLCKPDKINGVEHIKKSLKKIQVHHTMRTVKDVLLLDIGFGQWLGGEEAVLVPAWSQLLTADFSHNDINYLDESVKLMPRMERLDLSYNRLQDVQQLQNLSALCHLDLAHNHIRVLETLHTKLGNIKVLRLAANKLESLVGFSKLYSLEQLDVSYNEISQIQEVKHLSSLPCLEQLNLVSNPVTIVLDYRTKVLEVFGDRAKEVVLDKEKASQKELDTVAILLAIQKSKDKSKKSGAKQRDAEISDATNSAAPSSSTSQAAIATSASSASLAPVDPESSSSSSFRIQVEQIREQGGAAWLTLLNQIQQPSNEPPPPPPVPKPPTEKSVKQSRYMYEGTVDVNRILTESDSHTSKQSSSTGVGLVLPETMPGRNDTTFVSILQNHVPDMHIEAQRSGVVSDQREERPVHLLWTSAICYTTPYKQIPTCVFITTENIHIFLVKAIKGSSGMPAIDHMYCIPLMNVQQIVLGHQNMYIRIEEAFVGPQGTFTLLTSSPNKTDLFLDSLKLAYRRAAPDLDQYEDPHVVKNEETELNLRSKLNSCEQQENASSVKVLLFMLVHAADVSVPSMTNDIHSLVITARYIYLLREDYILWPQPTFAIGPSTRPQFEIVSIFPILGKITGIQMYDTDSQSPGEQGLSGTFSATNSSSMLVSNFIGYGLKLTFDMGPEGVKSLNVRVTTSGMRDRILATLTQARKDLTERSPSPSKKKSKSRESRYRESTRQAVLHNSGHDENKQDGLSGSGSTDSISEGFLPGQRGSPTGASSNTLESLDDAVTQSEEPQQSETTASEKTTEIIKESPIVTENILPKEQSPAIPPKEQSPAIPQVRKTSPPRRLNVVYPQIELLMYLTQCNEAYKPLQPLSEQMQLLVAMDGEEMVNYFHNNVAQIGYDNEELHHILWVDVVPYCNPNQEILTCVFLTTSAVYFVSDDSPCSGRQLLPPVKRGHMRNCSDPGNYQAVPVRKSVGHHVSGILHEGKKGAINSYHTLSLKDLKEVNVGLFDQCFRLVGASSSSVFTCVTRDSKSTELFVRRLMGVLSRVHPSPSPDILASDGEQDFYKMFAHQTSQSETQEYIHPSKVKFVYPNDEVIADLTYLIAEYAQKTVGTINPDSNILGYSLVYIRDMDSPDSEKRHKSRTLVVTQRYISLIVEDLVSYPLTHFAKGLPMTKHHIVQNVRNVSSLKRVHVSGSYVSLGFVDKSDWVLVDTAVDHYSAKTPDTVARNNTDAEVTWELAFHSSNEQQRLIKSLKQLWNEKNDGQELEVVIKDVNVN